jgi:hypothetical protein|uniref:Uncharacterized protein n=1 Tax=uncultured prokaryote TaxID=198431 RepID=A0A0H5Q7Q0_9ZZZZ|nr:hypothetical protein [uncultured prokaryote]
MAVFNPARTPHGAMSVAQPWAADARDHVPAVSSRLTSRWAPDSDGRQVWRWSITNPDHP